MAAVALITPTYSLDLERCALLCESVDRYVTSFSCHYLIVPDDELAMFAGFGGGRRVVVPLSEILPTWLKPLPRFIQRNRRRYWGSLRAKPVGGWYVQQFAKIATAQLVPETLACVLDSDIVFFRPYQLSAIGQANATPLFIRPREIAAAAREHASWVRSSHRLLGLDEPLFPADDFIGHIIFWNQRTVRAMTARLEKVSGRDWIEALCRTRGISEYMLYGFFVRNTPALLRDHRYTTVSPCLSYWEADALDEAALERMLLAATDDCVALSAQSFSNTPVHRIRAVLERLPALANARSSPLATATPPAQETKGATMLSRR